VKGTYAENSIALGQSQKIWRVGLILSKRGCKIIRFASGQHMPALQLLAPLEGIETQPIKLREREFDGGEFMGCRVYWERIA
jgi:hypothetical protein